MGAHRFLPVRLWHLHRHPHLHLSRRLPSPHPDSIPRRRVGLLGNGVQGHWFSSSTAEEPSSSSSWLQRLKGLFLGPERVQTAADQRTVSLEPQAQVSAATDDLSLEKFADELKKAHSFGKMTQFGRGLPRGGEAIAARSLQKQEEILRKLAIHSPDGQFSVWKPSIRAKWQHNVVAR